MQKQRSAKRFYPSCARTFAAGLLLLFPAAITILAQKPELVLQTGHTGYVSSVAFSSDGKVLATGGWDKKIKLWDVQTGRELRALVGHFAYVTSVNFSPDRKLLASGSWDATVKLWDVTTGTVLRTLAGHSDTVYSVAFSSDGKIIAGGSKDKTIKLWDVATGREIKTLQGHTSDVRSIAFSPDGKVLASGSSDQSIKLWDVSTGQDLRTLVHGSYVQCVAFSADGKRLASGTEGDSQHGRGPDIKIWDLATGNELRTLSGHAAKIDAVAFSSDGVTLASGSADKTIKLWEIATGRELQTLTGHTEAVAAVTFSSDGKTLATGSNDQTVKLWDAHTGRELRTLSGHTNHLHSIGLSPEGRTLASPSENKIKLWDVATGGNVRTLSGYKNYVLAIAFSPNGKTLAGGGEEELKLWDVATGRELRTLLNQDMVQSLAFSPDGKLLASGSIETTIALWDVATGRKLRTLLGHTRSISSLAFSPDGNVLASGSIDKTVSLWDVRTARKLSTLSGHLHDVDSVAFSPDGKMLASGSGDRTIKFWDVATGKELRTLSGHSGEGISVAFSPNGKTLASGSWDNTIRIWDVATGRELRTFPGLTDYVGSIAFSVDGKTLVSQSWDDTIRFWDPDTGRLLASLISSDDSDWVVATPDGLFDGSPNAWNQILWRFNQDTFNVAPVEIFFNEFYYPDLLNDLLEGKRPRATQDIATKDRRQPRITLSLSDEATAAKASPPRTEPGNRVSAEQLARIWRKVRGGSDSVITARIDISEAPAGAQDVRLFRNGLLVKVWHGDVLQGQSGATLYATISIPAGENRLTAYAFNHDNIKSSDATVTATSAPGPLLKYKGTAYVIAVGINEYANPQYNLRYAVADAQSFAAEVKLQQAKLKNYASVEIVLLNDKDATKAALLKALTDLSTKIQPEDAVIIYFAGHGTAQGNRFYLVPHDLGYEGPPKHLNQDGLQSILSHSISDEELQNAVESMSPGQLILIVDACNSGQALEAEEKRRGPMNSKGLAQLAYEKGMYILTAAQSYQAANEAERYGHGFLTYALVEEGLKTGAADKQPKDGQVLLREWLDFATERVPQMQQDKLDEQKKQGRQLDRIKFAEADSGSEGSIQRPRVFYRRETETHPLVVARP